MRIDGRKIHECIAAAPARRSSAVFNYSKGAGRALRTVGQLEMIRAAVGGFVLRAETNVFVAQG
jgi:hypothetical protein